MKDPTEQEIMAEANLIKGMMDQVENSKATQAIEDLKGNLHGQNAQIDAFGNQIQLDSTGLAAGTGQPVFDIDLDDLDDLDLGIGEGGIGISNGADNLNANINLAGSGVENVLGLTDSKRRLRKHVQSITHDTVDIEDYEYIFDNAQGLQDAYKQGKAFYEPFGELMADIYLSLFKYHPQFVPIDMMEGGYRLNQMILSRLAESSEWRTLREMCKLDALSSAIGTHSLATKALEVIEEIKDEFQEMVNNGQMQQNPIDIINQAAQTGQSLAQAAGQAAGMQQFQEQLVANGQQPNQQVAESLQQTETLVETLEEQLMDMTETLVDNAAAMENSLRKNILDMPAQINNAIGEVKEIQDTVEQWGMDPGSAVRVSVEGKRMAIEKMRRSPKLKKIGEMLGKLRQVANFEQKKKAKDGKLGIKSVETGNDMQSILPSERMLLCNDDTKPTFYQKYNEKQLLQYSRDSHKVKARGPMVVCVDTSGSMNGSEETWSKAVAVALLEIAQKQKRDFACILFDSDVDDVFIVEKGYLDPMTIVGIAETFSGGGTSFEPPLQKALDLIQDSKFKKADITFITDGDCGLDDGFLRKFNDIKERKNFAVQSIIINTGGHCSDATLKKFSDNVTQVSDLTEIVDPDSDVAHSIFSGV